MNGQPISGITADDLLTRWAGRIAHTLFGVDMPAAYASRPALASDAEAAAPADFAALVQRAAQRHGLPQELLTAVIQAESNFNPQAVSSAGAKGLMQLMDGTARALGVHDSFDPAQNVEGGATYLRQMLDRYHSIPLALAAYNAGPGAVDNYGGVPPYAETQTYVKRIMGLCGGDWEA